MSAEAPIALEDVSYTYGKGARQKQILFNIDTSIQAGEIIILTGPSGSGKTTLLTLMGDQRSDICALAIWDSCPEEICI